MSDDVVAAMSAERVFDRSALDDLTEQLASEIVVSFAERFLELLPHRVRRIRDCLDEADRVASLDAVLSLKVTSMTVGGTALGSCAASIEDFVRSGDLRSASLRAAELDERAAAFATAIASYIDSTRSTDWTSSGGSIL